MVFDTPLMTPLSRLRTDAGEPWHPVGGEDLLSKTPVSLRSVSPRSVPPPPSPPTAYCISLVTTAGAQASDEHSSPSPSPGASPGGTTALLSPRGRCQQLELLVGQGLACLPGPTRYRYTGLVTQSPSVPPDRLWPGCRAEPTSGPPAAAGRGGRASSIGTGSSTAVRCVLSTLATSAMRSSSGGGGGGGPLLDVSSVRTLLNAAWPRLVLDRMLVVPVPALPWLQRIYELRVPLPSGYRTAGGTHDMLVLVLAPPSMLRLLRSEQWIVKSEAIVVKWIRGMLVVGGSAKATKAAECDYEEACPACKGAASDPHPFRFHEETLLKDTDLLRLLPALIDHSQSAKELGSAYNILSQLNGLSLSSLPRCLSIPERKHVDFQAGRLMRRLSLLRSPSGKFGPAISVLYPTATAQSRAGGSMESPGGMDSWSLAFHAMLEGILRDAEDMAVTVPYQTIRRHFRRLGHHLDAIAVPRLVILDAAHDSNIMVERLPPGHSDGRMTAKTSALQGRLEDSDDSGPEEAGPRGQGRENNSSIQVTGLRNWSNCIFADPLMAMVFSERPSRDFLHGFSGRRPGQPKDNHLDAEEVCGYFDSFPSVYGDVVECPEEARVRLLFYQCYHATVAVVKEFYRPRSDSTSREFAARKLLSAVLARLEDIEGGPKRSHARPSGEMSPAKKPRTEDDYSDAFV